MSTDLEHGRASADENAEFVDEWVARRMAELDAFIEDGNAYGHRLRELLEMQNTTHAELSRFKRSLLSVLSKARIDHAKEVVTTNVLYLVAACCDALFIYYTYVDDELRSGKHVEHLAFLIREIERARERSLSD